MGVTKKDVAEKANVSTATVSNVINGTKYVSDELKERVNKAIKELNYRPNILAQSLVTRKTKQVAIVVDDITNPIFSEQVLGFERKAKELGYIVNVCIGNNFLDEYFDDLYSRHIDGIYLTSTFYELFDKRDKLYKLLDNGTVLVQGYDLNLAQGKSSIIQVDYFNGMKLIFEHLIDLGHNEIGFLGFTNRDARGDNTRFKSYKKCLKIHGLNYRDNYVVFGEPPYNTSNDDGYIYMKKLLKRKIDITAVIVTNDYMATGVLDALKEKGYHVPRDMSLVSFDNSIFARIKYPKLTTVNPDNEKQGVEAMKLINRMIKHEENNLTKRMNTELIIRDSTDKPKQIEKLYNK